MRGIAFGWLIALGVSVSLLVSVPGEVDAAGLFKKLGTKIKAKRQERAREEAKETRRTPYYRTGYYDSHQDAYINHKLLENAGDAERKVVIDIGKQRAYLVIHDMVAIDTAVSTARGGYLTPRGTFEITERIKFGKISTLYHCHMPNWMRLGHSMIGMHTGDLPGYPASHGCIRMPQTVAPIMFDNTDFGLKVEVVDNWEEQELAIPYTIPYTSLLADASQFY